MSDGETTMEMLWDFPDETVRLEPHRPELPTITTGQVSNQTIFECPTCSAHNYLKNGKCIRCDYGVV
jgi:hypothetical protein